MWIHEILKPIFVELSDDELLNRCLHGETQNANEGLNNIIWSKCPKSIYVDRPILELGVNSAVLSYNEGNLGLIDNLAHFGLDFGICSSQLSEWHDNRQVNIMENEESEVTKAERKKRRARKKGLIDKETEKEPVEAYCAGGF